MQRVIVIALVGVLLALPLAADQAGRTAEQAFDEGRTLVATNGRDVPGATRQGLEAGIAAILEAIQAGYPDRVEAYRTLAEAYDTFRLVHADRNTLEQRETRAKQAEVYHRLLELLPKDADLHLDYASFVTGEPAKRLVHLRKAIELRPVFPQAHYSLSRALFMAGDWKQGLAEGRLAISQAPPREAGLYSKRIAVMLDTAGQPTEAALIRAEQQAREAAAAPAPATTPETAPETKPAPAAAPAPTKAKAKAPK